MFFNYLEVGEVQKAAIFWAAALVGADYLWYQTRQSKNSIYLFFCSFASPLEFSDPLVGFSDP